MKRELNVGEEREMWASMRRQLSPGESLRVDPTLTERARVLAYLLNWSFVGPDGAPLELSASTIDAFQCPVFREICEALDAHDESVREAREAEKKTRRSASGLSEISPSAA